MSNLTHLFRVGQVVRCRFDNDFCMGTVKETYPNHIINCPLCQGHFELV